MQSKILNMHISKYFFVSIYIRIILAYKQLLCIDLSFLGYKDLSSKNFKIYSSNESVN